MSTNEELRLLIKSKYPVIYLESIDETHTVRELQEITQQLNLHFYQWSLSEGLRIGDHDSSYFETKEPAGMLRRVLSLLKPSAEEKKDPWPSVFLLKDFNKYLGDPLTLRLFKDSVNRFKEMKNTFVILSAEYNLPRDIEADAAHLISGYPVEEEIREVIEETCAELKRTMPETRMNLQYKEFKNIIGTLKGLSIQQIRNIVTECFLNDNVFDVKDLKSIESFKKKTFDQEGLLEFCLTEDKDNIAGFGNLKRWLSERRDAFSSDQSYPLLITLPVPRGVLLMGVQGCGKSLAARIIARELNLPLYRLDLSTLYSKYIGETEQNMRKALKIVENLNPVCLWIDEIEKGFAASAGDVDGGVSMRLLGTFLTWMQEHKSRVFVTATANNIYMLPPEFLRKGRFDEIFFVDLPDKQARETLFKIHLQKRGLNPDDYDLKKLAETAVDFSGAEVEQAIISALYHATSGKEPICADHIIEQIESTKPLAVLKCEEISALRSWSRERTIPV